MINKMTLFQARLHECFSSYMSAFPKFLQAYITKQAYIFLIQLK